MLKLCKRCCDRGCCNGLKADREDGDDERVNTKLLLQADVNALYTGDQIQSHFVYAQNYVYLWCVMMFSTGLPILYPFAAVFYFGFYWAYKFLLLKYYMKTSKFTADLPIRSTSYIPAAVLMHIVIGGLMVTNSNILPDGSDESASDHVAVFCDGTGVDCQGDEEHQNLIRAFLAKLFTTSKGVIYVLFGLGYVSALIFKNVILACAWKLL